MLVCCFSKIAQIELTVSKKGQMGKREQSFSTLGPVAAPH